MSLISCDQDVVQEIDKPLRVITTTYLAVKGLQKQILIKSTVFTQPYLEWLKSCEEKKSSH